MQAFKYRADIDGMRAIAVVAVILFHLDIAKLAGGYVGVDIFFVISGFLITSIIWSKQAEGQFRLSGFYLGRIRRLLPPLYVTVLATFIASAFILLPDDFARFSRSAIASLFSVSNILFFFEAGYWDTASHLKPLLHTWSLGVEEQFYLVWPLFVIFCATALRRVPFVLILIVVSILSTLAMLWYSEWDLSGAFYLFPFRVFQFSLGALIAFSARLGFLSAPLKLPVLPDLIAVCGLGLIGYSIVDLNDGAPFPGVNALPPTLGAMLILYAGSGAKGQGLLGRLLLENPLSVFLGKISYAAYLVHWPIIVLYRYETGDGFSMPETAALGAATLLAAIVLYYGVERQFYQRASEKSERKTKRVSNSGFAVGTLVVGLAMSSVAAHTYLTNGWVWRFPQIALSPEAIEAGKQARFKFTGTVCSIHKLRDAGLCTPLDGPQIDILFLGNSHEPDGYNFIMSGYATDNPLQLLKFGTVNECKSLRREEGQWKTDDPGCQQRLDALFQEGVPEGLEAVVFSSYLPFSTGSQLSIEMLEDLRRRNPELKIIVFGGYIGTKEDCSYLINQSVDSSACKDPENVDYFESDPFEYPLYGRVRRLMDYYIDRVGLHCPGRKLEACETETAEGIPLSYDRHHASLEFAAYGGRKYAAEHPDLFRKLFSERPQGNPDAEQAAVYSLSGRYEDVKATPIVSVEILEHGARLTPIGPFNDRRTGADTGAPHIVLGGNIERRLSNRSIQVRYSGVAESATEIWLQYSTNDVGNSGWVKVNVGEGPFEAYLDYHVPQLVRGGADFVGIAPITSPILLQDIEIEIVR